MTHLRTIAENLKDPTITRIVDEVIRLPKNQLHEDLGKLLMQYHALHHVHNSNERYILVLRRQNASYARLVSEQGEKIKQLQKEHAEHD